MPGTKDSYLTFDEDYSNTKAKVKTIFKNHEYYPKVDIFFKQSDELIVKKLGELKAYEELSFSFVQSLFDLGKKENAADEHEENDQLNSFDKTKQLESNIMDKPGVGKVGNEKMFTRIRQIADYFNCSIPTAQKINNKIPKDQYSQKERTFAIPESVLLKNRERS